MKKVFSLILALWTSLAFAQEYKVFHTSVCYDMLSSFDKLEEIISQPFFANTLAKDSLFIKEVRTINQHVRPSNICNLYASLPSDKDDVSACLHFFSTLKQEDIPTKFRGKYVESIYGVMPEILRSLEKLIVAGYPNYWQQDIYPKIKKQIDGYTFEEGILDKIHYELLRMAGDNTLGNDYAKIYILDIDNAFSLNDETFCCTPILLNKEIAKKYHVNFIHVYIHENLHRLHLSQQLVQKLENLYQTDEFYRTNEEVARKYGEGKNEAFIVAAETYISKRLGLRSDEEIYKELTEYVDGSLVLSPIVYLYIDQKPKNQSFDTFLVNLFNTKKIEANLIQKQYTEAIEKLKNDLLRVQKATL